MVDLRQFQIVARPWDVRTLNKKAQLYCTYTPAPYRKMEHPAHKVHRYELSSSWSFHLVHNIMRNVCRESLLWHNDVGLFVDWLFEALIHGGT